MGRFEHQQGRGWGFARGLALALALVAAPALLAADDLPSSGDHRSVIKPPEGTPSSQRPTEAVVVATPNWQALVAAPLAVLCATLAADAGSPSSASRDGPFCNLDTETYAAPDLGSAPNVYDFDHPPVCTAAP